MKYVLNVSIDGARSLSSDSMDDRKFPSSELFQFFDAETCTPVDTLVQIFTGSVDINERLNQMCQEAGRTPRLRPLTPSRATEHPFQSLLRPIGAVGRPPLRVHTTAPPQTPIRRHGAIRRLVLQMDRRAEQPPPTNCGGKQPRTQVRHGLLERLALPPSDQQLATRRPGTLHDVDRRRTTWSDQPRLSNQITSPSSFRCIPRCPHRTPAHHNPPSREAARATISRPLRMSLTALGNSATREYV